MFHVLWVIMCRRCNYLRHLSCYVAEVPVIVDVVVDVVMSSPTKARFHSGLGAAAMVTEECLVCRKPARTHRKSVFA